MPNVATQAKGLTKWFGEGQAKTTALREVELKAVFGEMVYIVEPSGSGKTTLLSVLSGILKPNSGSVSVEGIDIWSLSADQLAELRLQKIGFVFPRLPLVSTVEHRRECGDPLDSQEKRLG
jgi:putative ABC transport system ATP-binding protein